MVLLQPDTKSITVTTTTAIALKSNKLQLAALPLLICCLCWHPTCAVVASTPPESADVAYIRAPNHLGPRTWHAGVACLDSFANIYFWHREQLTRSYNVIVTVATNMSTPAAQIQEGYLRLLNEAVSDVPPQRKLFQIRIVSDALPYQHVRIHSRDLLLADYYVIVVDQVARLKRLMADYVSKFRSWNPGSRYLILFNNVEMHTRGQADAVATEIFNYMMKELYIHRVSVLYALADVEYIFIGSDYFSNVACRQLRLRAIGKCRDGQLLPSKAKVQQEFWQYFGNFTMQNCTINICTSPAEPFIENDCENGLEMRLLAFIKNRLNFETNIICSQETRGILEPNGSWNGLLGLLERRSCDFIMGGFYPDNDVFESFWNSDCYLEDSFTWFYKVAEKRPPFFALYTIFENETWLCLILMLFLSWFFLWLFVNVLPELHVQRQISLNGLNALGLTICVSIFERPLHNTGRIFFMTLTLYGVNIITIYTSKLISVFGDPGLLHQISTLQEAIKLNIPFGGDEENIDWFESPEDMWILEHYNNSPEFDVNFENFNAVKEGKRILLSSRAFVLQHPHADSLYGFPMNVFSSPIQMIMKAGFPFLFDLNVIIRYTRDAGIFEKINRDFEYNNTYLKRIAEIRPEFQEQVIVLTTEHLQGAFALLSFGIIFGTLLFIGELITFHLMMPYYARYRSRSKHAQRKYNKKGNLKKTRSRNKDNKWDGEFKKMELGRATRLVNLEGHSEFKVNVVQGVRFTPLKRRHFIQ